MFGYSFMNYACLLRRLAKGASARDFVQCYLKDGVFYAHPIDSVPYASAVFPYHGEPLIFLGYSRVRSTL